MKKNSSFTSFSVPGLSDRESLIWHALSVESRPFLVTDIAKETGLHRPMVYQVLASLIEKGLIQTIPYEGRKFYGTTGPKSLEKFRAAHDQHFAKHLFSMKLVASALPTDEIRVYKGKEIQEVWNAVLASPKGTVFYRYDAYPASRSVTAFIPKEYYERLEKKKMERFVITNHALRSASYKKRIECASRVLPKSLDAFEQGVTQFIFGDTFALIDLNTKTAFVIHNPAIVAFQKQLFKGLFRLLKE